MNAGVRIVTFGTVSFGRVTLGRVTLGSCGGATSGSRAGNSSRSPPTIPTNPGPKTNARETSPTPTGAYQYRRA